MSKKIVDGITKDWGERLYPTPAKGRKWKNPKGGSGGGGGGGRTPSKAPVLHGWVSPKLSGAVRKTPEVMVKISGGGKNIGRIKAHMDYISRNGDVALEDEKGEVYLGRDEVKEVCKSWRDGQYAIPLQGERRREAFNIVLSMPPGTSREGVHAAAREFAKEKFGNHQYVFAAHDDEKHPHVHLSVKAQGRDGMRLNPRKGDLQEWRELFADKLREQGIEANATARRARGVVKKAEPQAVLHIDKEFQEGVRKAPSKVSQSREKEAKEAIKTGGMGAEHERLKEGLQRVRAEIQRDYGEAARELARGAAEDRKLSLEVARFIKEMGPVETKAEAAIKKVLEGEAVVHKERAGQGQAERDRTRE